MVKMRWSITLDGLPHDIMLVHHRLGNLAEIFVDGESAVRYGSAGDLSILNAADFRFDVDGHEIEIHIRSRILKRLEYGISVDGVQLRQDATTLSSFEEHVRNSKIISVLFVIFFAFPILVAGGRDWEFAGIRCDYIGWGCLALGIIAAIRLFFSYRS